GAFTVSGLDSLVSQLTVIGEGVAGPNRQYHGHALTPSLSSDRGDGSATRGSVNYPVLSLSIRNDSFESIDLGEFTFTQFGTIQEETDVVQMRLWEEKTADGEVTLDGNNPDLEIDTPQTFSMGSDQVTFDLSGRTLPPNGTIRILLAADLSP